MHLWVTLRTVNNHNKAFGSLLEKIGTKLKKIHSKLQNQQLTIDFP